MNPAKRLMLELVEYAPVYSGPRKPGRFIEGMPQRMRDVLKELTSDDLKDVRVDGMFSSRS